METDRTQHSKAEMERLFKEGYKFFMDTCCLIFAGAEQNPFWENIKPYLITYNTKIYIPKKCIDELMKHTKNTSKPELANQSKAALKKIEEMREYISISSDTSDVYADNVFISVFSRYRMKYNLILLTSDKALATDILALNNTLSVQTRYNIAVKQVSRYGYLANVNLDRPATGDAQPGTETQGTANNRIRKSGTYTGNTYREATEEEKFDICTKITTIPDMPMPLSAVPTEGATVYTKKGNMQSGISLEKKLGSGGEAVVYKTSKRGKVAKIYNKGKNSQRTYEKLQRMLAKPVKYPGICYPESLLYNDKGEFIGVLMPEAKGKTLQETIFFPMLIPTLFPIWKRRDLVELAVTILDKICYLHDRNIIIGDLNPQNIMIVSQKEVYFIDTDSYQIDDIPCPVGTTTFTAPEIQNREYNSFLRTKGNEDFAVATLLFMLMLPGKAPYACQGGESMDENIKKMDFSYPFGENSNRKAPDGKWRFMWSHLTFGLKESFYKTFRKGEEFSEENTRLSANTWRAKFRYFLHILDDGTYAQQDAMSLEIMPTRYKLNKNINYIVCDICGQSVPEDTTDNGLCRDCQREGEHYKCEKCDKDLIYTNKDKYNGKKKYTTCKECFEKSRQIAATITCKCGHVFTMTQRDVDYYKSKGLELPKRCPDCRRAAKSGAAQQTQYKQKVGASTQRPSSSSQRSTRISQTASHTQTATRTQTVARIQQQVSRTQSKSDDSGILSALLKLIFGK